MNRQKPSTFFSKIMQIIAQIRWSAGIFMCYFVRIPTVKRHTKRNSWRHLSITPSEVLLQKNVNCVCLFMSNRIIVCIKIFDIPLLSSVSTSPNIPSLTCFGETFYAFLCRNVPHEKEVEESKPKQPPHLFHFSCGQCFEIWGSKLALDFHIDVAHRKRD